MSSARKIIWGEKAEAIEAALRDLDDDLAELVIKVAYDDVFSREGLDLRTRELISIAHLINVGTTSELKTHLHGALNAGATLTEIKETLLHSAMFVGFPKVLKAMKALRDIEAALENSA